MGMTDPEYTNTPTGNETPVPSSTGWGFFDWFGDAVETVGGWVSDGAETVLDWGRDANEWMGGWYGGSGGTAGGWVYNPTTGGYYNPTTGGTSNSPTAPVTGGLVAGISTQTLMMGGLVLVGVFLLARK